MSDLVGNPEDRFSHNEAHFMTCLAFAIAVGGDINKGVQCGLSLGSILFDF